MKYNVVVATHHKTGTVWMDGVFKALAREIGVQCIDFTSAYGCLAGAPRKPYILLNVDSNFRDCPQVLEREDVRVLHVIRDPRDMLISAMYYHSKSTEN